MSCRATLLKRNFGPSGTRLWRGGFAPAGSLWALRLRGKSATNVQPTLCDGFTLSAKTGWLQSTFRCSSHLDRGARSTLIGVDGKAIPFMETAQPERREAMKRTIILGLTVMLSLAMAHRLSASPQRHGSGTLAGVVLGPDDKPVPHAAVTYQSSAGMAPHAVHTDASGHFYITNLRRDDYDLRASSKGVFSEWEKNVAVRPGKTKSVTLRLIYAKDVPQAYTKSKPNPQ